MARGAWPSAGLRGWQIRFAAVCASGGGRKYPFQGYISEIVPAVMGDSRSRSEKLMGSVNLENGNVLRASASANAKKRPWVVAVVGWALSCGKGGKGEEKRGI